MAEGTGCVSFHDARNSGGTVSGNRSLRSRLGNEYLRRTTQRVTLPALIAVLPGRRDRGPTRKMCWVPGRRKKVGR